MTNKEELSALERNFWLEGAEYYRANLAEDCLMVFPEPVGVLARERSIAAIEEGPRWSAVRLDDLQVRQLVQDVVVLVYRATGERDGQEKPYEALATSTYVKQQGDWKLALHQQTPLAES